MALISRLQPEWPSTLPLAFSERFTGTRTKNAILSKLCMCKSGCSEFWFFFHDSDDVKSMDRLNNQIIALIQTIWVASYTQKLKPCVLRTVRECIKACKRTESSTGPLSQFYNLQVEGKSLPASIILHSLSDSLSKSKTRHRLLQMILDELPLTAAVRDELYQACAKTGFNEYFKRIRTKSLKCLQTVPASQTLPHTEIGYGLRLRSGFVENVTVVPVSNGFKLMWVVPDILQRLQSGFHLGTEFVARGNVWGLYISAPYQVFEVTLCVMKPSQANLYGNTLSVDLRVSPYSETRVGAPSITFDFQTQKTLSIADFPVEGGIPHTETSWIFNQEEAKSLFVVFCGPYNEQYIDIKRFSRQHINKDGTCHLAFRVRLSDIHAGVPVKCYKKDPQPQ